MSASRPMLCLTFVLVSASPVNARADCVWSSDSYGDLGNKVFTNVQIAKSSSGTVLTAPIIDYIFLGSYWNTSGGSVDQAAISQDICPTANAASFWQRLSQYGVTSGKCGSTATIMPTVAGTPANPVILQETSILAALTSDGLTVGGNHIPIVFLPPDVYDGTERSGAGHHNSAFLNQTRYAYAMIEYGGSCGPHCWQSEPPTNVDALLGLATHEAAEAATNPFGDGYHANLTGPTGVVDNLEIGDFCNGQSTYPAAFFTLGPPTAQVWQQNQCRCEGSKVSVSDSSIHGELFSSLAITVTEPTTKTTKCIDIQNNASANGTPLVIWDCTQGGQASQQWTAMSDGTIHSVLYPNKCIDLPGGNVNNNTKLDIWDCVAGAQNEVWAVTPLKDQNAGGWIIGSGSKCIDLPGGTVSSLANGTQLDYYDCTNSVWNEAWGINNP